MMIFQKNHLFFEKSNIFNRYDKKRYLENHSGSLQNTVRTPGLLQKMSKKCNSPGIFSMFLAVFLL